MKKDFIKTESSPKFVIGDPNLIKNNKTHKIVIPLRHTGLLQDNFGNPNLVGVTNVAPRQGAFIFGIPFKQQGGESFHKGILLFYRRTKIVILKG